MIVRPMRSPDRGFITTEAGRDSNGSVFTECGNRQNTALVHCAGIEPTDLPVMSGVLWPTELAMRLSDAGAGLACRKAPKNMPSTAIVPSHPLMLGGTGGGVDARIRSAPGRSRTGCARFRKPALYPLSYKGVAS